MNISPQKITGTCNYKCVFSFSYPISQSSATNGGNYINLSYNNTTPCVTFNNSTYVVDSINIYSPSLHLYNNSQVDGEIVINHIPTQGGNKLTICLPLSLNGTSNKATQIITAIVSAISSGAPSKGGTTNQGIDDFTLNDFLPMAQFYNYSTESTDFVIFGLENAINISNTSLKALTSVIKPVTSVIFQQITTLFLNPSGPQKVTSNSLVNSSAVTVDNNIYIDCQPTSESQEKIDVVTNIKNPIVNDLKPYFDSIFSNETFLIVFSSIIFIFFILIIYYTVKHFTKKSKTIVNSVPKIFNNKIIK